jgi:hypothetical protein
MPDKLTVPFKEGASDINDRLAQRRGELTIYLTALLRGVCSHNCRRNGGARGDTPSLATPRRCALPLCCTM